MTNDCAICGAMPAGREGVGFRDTCPRCGRDLHVCRNCRFYERGAYNDCRESQAERVLDKEKANFCEYFTFEPEKNRAGRGDDGSGARKRLEDLFKGGPS